MFSKLILITLAVVALTADASSVSGPQSQRRRRRRRAVTTAAPKPAAVGPIAPAVAPISRLKSDFAGSLMTSGRFTMADSDYLEESAHSSLRNRKLLQFGGPFGGAHLTSGSVTMMAASGGFNKLPETPPESLARKER